MDLLTQVTIINTHRHDDHQFQTRVPAEGKLPDVGSSRSYLFHSISSDSRLLPHLSRLSLVRVISLAFKGERTEQTALHWEGRGKEISLDPVSGTMDQMTGQSGTAHPNGYRV